MDDLMLYVMVGSMFGLFGWAFYEYAKAGIQFWRETHRSNHKSSASEGESKLSRLDESPEHEPPARSAAVAAEQHTMPTAAAKS